jgi:hypothetical protein
MERKECSRCKQEKAIHAFGLNTANPDGHKYICRDCDAEIHRLRYRGDANKLRERSKANRERARANHLCLSCYQPLGDRPNKYCEKCAAVATQAQKERRLRHLEACLAAYGGKICACCGETEPMFLTLDHIENNGSRHRRSLFGNKNCGSSAFYFALVKAGFPPGLQVLCWNCNLGRNRNGGICPHKESQ